jgi:penicillin-binding protein 2D
VRMIEDLGIQKAVDYAERIGVGTMPSVPSLALGSGEVTLESLTTAYSVFASGGLRRTPVYIKRVEDNDGQVLYSAPYESEQVVAPETAFLMTHMLADVVNYGTAWRARQLGFKLPAAGKTGTTNDYHDAWFVGYTPRLVTGVWIGFDQPQTIMASGYAAEVAVPLWAGFMRAATAGDPSEWYKAPKGVVPMQVCRLSGKRPTEACNGATLVNDEGESTNQAMVYTEYFVRGTEPDEECPIHQRSIVGRVAGWFGGSPSAPAQNRSGEIARASDDHHDQAPSADARSDKDDRDATKPAEKKKRGFWSRVFGRK